MNHISFSTRYIIVSLALTFYIHFLFGQSSDTFTLQNNVQFWLTDPNQNILFEKQQFTGGYQGKKNNLAEIIIDDKKIYQSMDGFGFTLTGGSARLINEMSDVEKDKLLTELFSVDGNNIGISYLRLSIGASDLSDSVFSYNDLNRGETDLHMEQFSIAPERKHLIPVLRQILTINPNILIMGSPWSAPSWMKTNNNAKGGRLRKDCFDAYARYFVKYINEMESEGIRIDAITVQNEPLHPGNNPSMYMSADDQAAFVKQSLGPAFASANIDTKIIIYDHNADRTDYPISILNDSLARKYINGSAFHLYGGTINDLLKVHEAHPDKHLYFTEQWIGAPGNFPADLSWHTENLIIGASRNWCKNVLEWNLAADILHEPHTDKGGCTRCLGAVTIDGDRVIRNPAYYIVAHASKFVRPCSVRIESSMPDKLPNVAFKTLNGDLVLIVLNKNETITDFNIDINGQSLTTRLNGGAVGTYIFGL
ncbi:hypothetical protein ES707_14539 [subsurface metagenome]